MPAHKSFKPLEPARAQNFTVTKQCNLQALSSPWGALTPVFQMIRAQMNEVQTTLICVSHCTGPVTWTTDYLLSSVVLHQTVHE